MRSNVMEGVPNFKFRLRDPDHAHFVVRWLEHVLNVCTKYEVSTFGHSKDIKGVPKFRNWSHDLRHVPLWSNFHILTKVCAALSLRKLWSFPNFKFRSRDPDHAHFRG